MQAPLSSGSASSSVASKLYSQSVTTEIVAQVSKLPQQAICYGCPNQYPCSGILHFFMPEAVTWSEKGAAVISESGFGPPRLPLNVRLEYIKETRCLIAQGPQATVGHFHF
jgi:hypothetical protein